MGLWEMIVAIVAITSAAEVIKQFARARGPAKSNELLAEIQALRAEVRELKQQNTDLFLALESSLEAGTYPPTRRESAPERASLPAEPARALRRE